LKLSAAARFAHCFFKSKKTYTLGGHINLCLSTHKKKQKFATLTPSKIEEQILQNKEKRIIRSTLFLLG